MRHRHALMFRPEMVRAIFKGKTQTRRLLGDRRPVFQPYAPGDAVWVKESWCTGIEYDRYPPHQIPTTAPITYLATAGELQPGIGKKRPSMFMTMQVSRLTLEILDVRSERLHDITEADSVQEGILSWAEEQEHAGAWDGLTEDQKRSLVRAKWGSVPLAYGNLWDEINGEGAWNRNPLVAVITFEAHHHNVLKFDLRAA